MGGEASQLLWAHTEPRTQHVSRSPSSATPNLPRCVWGPLPGLPVLLPDGTFLRDQGLVWTSSLPPSHRWIFLSWTEALFPRKWCMPWGRRGIPPASSVQPVRSPSGTASSTWKMGSPTVRKVGPLCYGEAPQSRRKGSGVPFHRHSVSATFPAPNMWTPSWHLVTV